MGPVDRHYLGRMVSAKVLGKYPKVLRADHPRLQYVRSILVTLARYSRVPYVYQEYVPIVIHDQAINAFAAPGGFVFITTGMLDFVINEDELALILAHELSHVELNHGVSAVTNAEGAKLMSQFVGDITGGAGMSQLVDGLLDFGEKGYDVSVEAEADARGLFIAQQAGYDPTVFPPLMERLKKVVGHYGGEGYPKERADLVRRQLVNNRYLGSRGSLEVRSDRFRMVMNRN
jgi:predicted Zn-dependent protease